MAVDPSKTPNYYLKVYNLIKMSYSSLNLERFWCYSKFDILENQFIDFGHTKECRSKVET